MAEAGERCEEPRESILLGSDAVFDFICDLCKDDGYEVEAEGFCVDCGEYLCRTCYNVHRKTRASRKHVLLDKSQMPKKADTLRREDSDRYFSKKCLNHKDEYIKYYCRQHDNVGCSACVTIEHRLCKGIKYIPDIAEDMANSQEYETLLHDLNNLTTLAKSVSADAKANVSKAEKISSDAIESVNQLVQVVKNTLQKLEENVRKHIEPQKKKDVESMESVFSRSDSILQEVENAISELKTMKKNKQLCQLFVAAKAAMFTVKTLESSLGDLKSSIKVNQYEFTPGFDIKPAITYPEAWGGIIFHDKTISGIDKEHVNIGSFTEAKHVTDIRVRSWDDKWPNTVSGFTILSDNRLVVADWKNPVLKLVDTSTEGVIAKMATESPPWDVVRITDDKVAVTLPLDKKIIIVRVSHTLVIEREIPVSGYCRGVASLDGKLIVTFVKPTNVGILVLDEPYKLDIYRQGNLTLNLCLHVAVYPDQETSFLVSDSSDNCVKWIRPDKLDKFEDEQLKSPSGIDIDERGNVFVCGSNSGNIFLLSPDLKMIKVLVSDLPRPRSVIVCTHTSQLYVGFDQNDYIKVYQLM